MSKIYVAWENIVTNSYDLSYNKHLYIVKDSDDLLTTTNDESITRGYAENNSLFAAIEDGFSPGKFLIQQNAPSSGSFDGLDNPQYSDHDGDNAIDTPTDRHYTEVALLPGQNADTIWSQMTSFAASIAAASYDYSLLGVNCQALVVSMLSSVGIDFANDVPADSSLGDYVSANVLLSGTGSDILQGFAGNDAFHDKGGGSDTFYGGVSSNQVLYDTTDGLDSVYYDNAGASVPVRVTIFGNSIGVNDGEGGTDTLFSIEEVVASHSTMTNALNYASYTQGITVGMADATIIANSEERYGNAIVNGYSINENGHNFNAYNFGTIIGSNYNDTFNLSVPTVLGTRAFDGSSGADTVHYAGTVSLFDMNTNSVYDSTGNAVDRLNHFETYDFKANTIRPNYGQNYTFVSNMSTGYDYSQASGSATINITASTSISPHNYFEPQVLSNFNHVVDLDVILTGPGIGNVHHTGSVVNQSLNGHIRDYEVLVTPLTVTGTNYGDNVTISSSGESIDQRVTFNSGRGNDTVTIDPSIDLRIGGVTYQYSGGQDIVYNANKLYGTVINQNVTGIYETVTSTPDTGSSGVHEKIFNITLATSGGSLTLTNFDAVERGDDCYPAVVCHKDCCFTVGRIWA